MSKILSTASFFLSLVFLFVLWAAFKPLEVDYSKSVVGQIATVESSPAASDSSPAAAESAEVKPEIEIPSVSQLRDAIPSVTLVADPSDGQVSAVTVKEGQFLLIKLLPAEEGAYTWFFDDARVPVSGEVSSYLAGRSKDNAAMEFVGWYHGKGTFRATFKFGIFALSPEQALRGETRPFIKVFHVDVTVE